MYISLLLAVKINSHDHCMERVPTSLSFT